MKHIQYDRNRANRLLPLLGAIGRELQERNESLEAVEQRIDELSGREVTDEMRSLVAEAATHRRELRQTKSELDRLGCSVVGTAPLTIRIPGRVGEAKKSFVWQTGDPVLK